MRRTKKRDGLKTVAKLEAAASKRHIVEKSCERFTEVPGLFGETNNTPG